MSAKTRSKAAELGNATVPITIFYRSNEEFAVFKEHIGCTPLLFMCLAGNLDMKDSHERGQFVATSHFAHQKAMVAFIIGPWDIWAIRPNQLAYCSLATRQLACSLVSSGLASATCSRIAKTISTP